MDSGAAAGHKGNGVGESRSLRALVVAGLPALVGAVRTPLAEERFEVEIVDARHALQGLWAASACDLIVLHAGTGGLDGSEWVRRLRASGSGTPVMILADKTPPGERAAGLDAGADDWITTPFDAAEFRARVRALLRRRGSRLVKVLTYGGLRFDTATHAAWVHAEPVELSPREASLLRMLLLHFNSVVTRERILDEFYGLCESAGTNTIEVYVSRLRRKLHASGLAIRTVHGRGYVIGVDTGGHAAG